MESYPMDFTGPNKKSVYFIFYHSCAVHFLLYFISEELPFAFLLFCIIIS